MFLGQLTKFNMDCILDSDIASMIKVLFFFKSLNLHTRTHTHTPHTVVTKSVALLFVF